MNNENVNDIFLKKNKIRQEKEENTTKQKK